MYKVTDVFIHLYAECEGDSKRVMLTLQSKVEYKDFFSFLFLCSFRPRLAACGILVPQLGIEPHAACSGSLES